MGYAGPDWLRGPTSSKHFAFILTHELRLLNYYLYSLLSLIRWIVAFSQQPLDYHFHFDLK